MPLHQPVPLLLPRHVRSDCPYAHNFQDYRRDPKKINYTVTLSLVSLKLVPTGPKDKSNPLKIQGVLSGWNAPKATDGLRKSIILILKNGKLANQKKFRSNKFNRSLLSPPKQTYLIHLLRVVLLFWEHLSSSNMKEVARPKGAKVAKRVQGTKPKRKENLLKKLKSGSIFPFSFLTMTASQEKIMKMHQR